MNFLLNVRFIYQVVFGHLKRVGFVSTAKELIKQLRLKGILGVKNHIINMSRAQMETAFQNEAYDGKFGSLVVTQTEYVLEMQLKAVKSFFKSKCEKPKVSVVIPVYNNYAYTLRCLYSIAISKDVNSYEVIIADDMSSDETFDVLSKIEGLKYIRNSENLGFLKSCNNAVKSAVGEYVFLLNNDTAVMDGWLDNLVDTFDDNKKVGLVGSKLIYPNGMLQEAGGILWNEGAANYGKFQDPSEPQYNYMREVDYVSGAAIMVPRALWNTLGGFDERYVPAYCEDSDLCLSIRDKGYKVLMQPKSVVIHFEGISSGTDLNSGVKQYQVVNSEKLKEKWYSLLQMNGEHGDFSRRCIDRTKGPRILFIDAVVPTPDQDAGSLTLWYFLKVLKQMECQITFLPQNLFNYQPYTDNLQKIGVECIYTPYVTDIDQYLKENAKEFDAVFLYRVTAGGQFYESIREYAPQTKIIFDTVDIHFLRLERQAQLEKNTQKAKQLKKEAIKLKYRELFLLESSDISIVLSDYEKEMLEEKFGISNTFVIPLAMEVPGCKNDFNQRQDIAFIGGYQHIPNVDAVMYFVENHWPKIKAKIQGVKFYIIGSKPTEQLVNLANLDDDIVVTGFVEDLEPYMNNLKLTVAPLRFGAGIKGKIGSSLSYGVPCVATNVAAEGMGLEQDVNVLMADNIEQFIDSLVMAYNRADVWNNLSLEGIKFVNKNYSIEATRERLTRVFDLIGVK
ncbi:glycosyltransferase [Vibrio plantisponsor]|uniref:glycosyltransferase n=1 Tax=Vibrio plantisponsor TaxID=664643 RepID=UPI00370AC839